MIIHKETLPLSPEMKLTLPKNAQILCVQVQRDIPRVWYSFNEQEKETVQRSFYIFTTGNRVTYPIGIVENLKYIGTFQLQEGSFIGHVYVDTN